MSESSKLISRISYCGLDCGTCYLKNGHIADHAKALYNELCDIQFDKWGAPLANINPKELASFCHAKQCMEVLKSWDCVRCEKFCKDGGGSMQCSIRDCCRERGYAGCFECASAESCDILGMLNPVNGNLNIENIRKIVVNGLAAFIEESSKSVKLKFYDETE
jgi:hypothetical protein